MIGWLSGKLRAKHPPAILLDVAGVGYEVEIPMTTFYDLPALGSPLELFIHHVSREDASLLYGFARDSDRSLFRMLIRINGVGPKMALGILSGMNAEQFSHCVQNNDASSLVQLPGVGKKTAERLIIEMRDKLDKPSEGDTLIPEASVADSRQEAISALLALGYKQAEASKRVNSVAAGADSCEDIIRLALQNASK